jgi:hypothetical protein
MMHFNIILRNPYIPHTRRLSLQVLYLKMLRYYRFLVMARHNMTLTVLNLEKSLAEYKFRVP